MFFQGLPGILQALEHERVLPEVRLGVVSRQPEDHEERLFEFVGPLHRILQGIVVTGALGLLHPVQNVVTVLDILVVELTDTLFLDTSHSRSPLQDAAGPRLRNVPPPDEPC
jgi:hypothetical protein